jgi:hypothetical protein
MAQREGEFSTTKRWKGEGLYKKRLIDKSLKKTIMNCRPEKSL